ncbi:MAG: CoA transferase subunit A [bacterium]|nr:CoA transferase subunit A [bacterium]
MDGDKRRALIEAAGLIEDGQMIALGGNSLTRIPAALVREMARQGRRGLRLVKTAGGYDIDLLCAAGAVAEVHSGYIGFENIFGLAPAYRRAVEAGDVRAVEHACSTVIAGLRASAYGLPSQPVAGLEGSDTPALTGFRQVEDPYTGKRVYMIPRIRPDWAILHVQYADAQGNARIDGGTFEDVLMSRAAAGVILTAEKIVETSFLEAQPERTVIPAFMVRAVVHAPRGAAPGSCHPFYELDEPALAGYIEAVRGGGDVSAHLALWEAHDRNFADRNFAAQADAERSRG